MKMSPGTAVMVASALEPMTAGTQLPAHLLATLCISRIARKQSHERLDW